MTISPPCFAMSRICSVRSCSVLRPLYLASLSSSAWMIASVIVSAPSRAASRASVSAFLFLMLNAV